MCNEKCKHGLGRGCYLFNGNIIDSIRLVPGSNPGQPIVLSCAVVTYLSSKVEFWVGISIYGIRKAKTTLF